MVLLTDCPACFVGRHDDHVERFAPSPEGMLGGKACPCKGDCAERSERRLAAARKGRSTLSDVVAAIAALDEKHE